jgi:hypothetical protein
MKHRGVFEPGEDRLIRQGVVQGEKALGSRQGVRRHDRWRMTLSHARFEVPGDCPRLSIIRRFLVRRRVIGAGPGWRRSGCYSRGRRRARRCPASHHIRGDRSLGFPARVIGGGRLFNLEHGMAFTSGDEREAKTSCGVGS